MARRRDRRQARDEARLKYGPQVDALSQILQTLPGERKTEVRQARRAGRMAVNAARRAAPQVAAIYGAAMQGNQAAQRMVADDLEKLGPDSPFRVAVAVGQGGAQSRLSEALASAGREVVGRQTDAAIGQQQEVRAIRHAYRKDTRDVLSQIGLTRKQAGDYAATRYGQLRGEAKDRKLEWKKTQMTARERRADRRQRAEQHADRIDLGRGVDPVTGKRLPKKGADKDGKKFATPVQQAAAQDTVTIAARVANQLKQAGLSRAAAAQVLNNSAFRKEYEKEGIDFGGIHDKPLFASIGFDLAWDGHISARNAQELRKRGIRVKKLGVKFNTGGKATTGGAQAYSKGSGRPD